LIARPPNSDFPVSEQRGNGRTVGRDGQALHVVRAPRTVGALSEERHEKRQKQRAECYEQKQVEQAETSF
jgi:hypothetical protein